MPLYERLMVLGIIDSNDDGVDVKTQMKPIAGTRTRTARARDDGAATVGDDKAVRAAFKRSQKKKVRTADCLAARAPAVFPILVIGSDDSDSEYHASSESDLSGDKDSFDHFDDDMSEIQMRNEQAVRQAISNSKDTLAFLGTAEALRQRSMDGETSPTATAACQTPAATLPAQFVPLKYPTGDVDASEGFDVCGFKGGKRVYRLASPHIARLQSLVVKTGVGLCYLDIASMLPPKVVEVSAESASTKTVMKGLAAVPAPPTPPTTPPRSPWSATQLASSFSAMALLESPSSPPSPPHRPHLQVNGCFVIRPSALGGLGAFALRELCRGEHILVEEPLFRTTLFHMPHELDKLAPEKRAQFDALTGHHPDPNASTAERIWTANTFEAGPMEAIFSLASRFNHACTPRNNIGYHFDRRKSVLIMTAIKKIPAGTELLITYGKSPSELFLRFGFRCVCGACSGFTEDMSREHQLKNWSG